MNQEPKKRKNRTKSNEPNIQRNFQCSCGRKYLSYSALYTHSKQKHGVTISTKNVEAHNHKNQHHNQRRNSPLDCPPHEKNQLHHKPLPTSTPKMKNYSVEDRIPTISNCLQEYIAYKEISTPTNEKCFIHSILTGLGGYADSHPEILEGNSSTEKYCDNHSPALLPLLLNNFFHEELHNLLDQSVEGIKTKAIKVLEEFAKWLYERQYTLFQINLIQSYPQ